jgi:tetratricopeptide (TPR) repeat protein
MPALIDTRYRPLRLLGHGGAGSVHLVEDTFHDDRLVALKILDLDADEVGRELLAREFYHLTKLVHPNLVKVFDFGVEPGSGRCYFTMEPVEGRDLLQATQGLELERTYVLLAQLCRALGYIHALGYVHNDVKPGNILVSDGEGGPRVRLLDFGLASLRSRRLEPSSAGGSVIQGTLHYLAPELLSGRAPDEGTDLYALGVVLYEVFTGRHPFEAAGSRRLGDALHDRPLPPSALMPHLPSRLDALVLRLLSPQPRERPETAHDVLGELAAIAGTDLHPETPETSASYVRGARLLQRDNVLALVDGVLRCVGAPGLAAMPAPAAGAVGPSGALEASSAAPGLLLLVGDTGVGKSRLLEEIRIRGQLAGILPLDVLCASGEVRHYGAICAILQRLVRSVADRPELVEELLEVHGAGVLKIFPELRPGRAVPPATTLPAAQEEERLHEQVSRFLLAIAALRPCLILIDDLAKVDERSLHLLDYLARNLWLRRQEGERLPVGLIATLQQDVPVKHPSRTKLEQIRSESFCWELLVEALDRDGVSQLIAAMFGLREVPQHFAGWVFALSEGNPLFVVELVAFLVDAGHIRRQDGRWRILLNEPAGLEIPKSLADIMGDRLRRLEPEPLRLLQVMAAVGRPVLETHLLLLSGLEPERSRRALLALLRRQLAVERRRGDRAFYELEHPAKGEVLYQQLPEPARRMLHLRIAHFLEEQQARGGSADVAEELARHYVLGSDLLGACRHAWAAGDGLRHIYSNKKALEMYQVVLEAFGACRARIDWRRFPAFTAPADGPGGPREAFPLGLGELVEVYWACFKLQMELGQYHEAMECATAVLYLAERTHNVRLSAQATKQIGSVYRVRGDCERATACIQRALESFRELEDVKGQADCLHDLGHLQYLLGRHLPSLEFYQQSLGIRKSLADRSGIAESYNNIGTVHFYLGNYNQSMDYFRRALEIRRSIDDKFGIGKNLNNIGLIHYQLGDLETARKLLEESLELKRSMSERAGVANTLSNLGEIHRTLGNYEKSHECESESLSIKRQIGDQQGLSISASNLGIVCTRLGRYDEALEHLSLALSTTRRIGFRVLEIEALCNLAETHFEIGNPRQALTLAEQALRMANASSSRPDQMTASLTLGHLYLELERPEDAVGHLHLASQLAADLSSKEKLASAQLLLGVYHRLSGRFEDALATLDKGLRLARDIKSRYLMARSCLEQGKLHLERSQIESAAEALRAARSSATRVTCPELEWSLCFMSGQLEAACRRYAPAFEQYRRCVEIFRTAAQSLAAPPMRHAYLSDRRRAAVAEHVRDLKSVLQRLVT